MGHTLISYLNDLIQVLLHKLKGTKLFLFVLLYWLRRNELLWHATVDENVVLL